MTSYLAMVCTPRHVPRLTATLLGILAFSAAPSPSAAVGMCSPPALGSPCPRGDVAGQGNTEPLPSLGIGNPVDLATGNKYQLDIDLPPNPHALGLELVRHYNGLSIHGGALGRNWSFSYDVRLQRSNDGWQVRQGDGSVHRRAHIIPLTDGFLWPWPNGRQLRFDAQGRLTSIRQGAAFRLRIQRHQAPHPAAGFIHRVQASNGHALEFHYTNIHRQVVVQSVQSPVGLFRYHYEQPPAGSAHSSVRLISVSRPDGMHRRYHYEPGMQNGNPYALTGISLQGVQGAAQRLTSWQYDLHGRVIKVLHHGRPVPALDIAYLRTATPRRVGHTRVSNSQGRQAGVHFRRRADGRHQMLDQELSYDRQGRMLEIAGTRLLRDADGQLSGLMPGHAGWPGLSLRYHRKLRRYAWHSTATGTTEQQADALGRPSVVNYGNGDSLRLTLDAQNRPLHIQASGGRAPGRHDTRLQWRGRRLLKVEHPFEIETRRLGDHGQLLERSIERPAALGMAAARFREAFRYDALGRLAEHRLPEGGILHYTWHTAPPHRHRLARLVWEDTAGQRRTVVDSDTDSPGYRYGNGLELLTVARAGPHADTLLLSRADTLVWRQTRKYDEAGRTVLDQHEYPAAQRPAARESKTPVAAPVPVPTFGRLLTASGFERLLLAYDERSRLRAAVHQSPEGIEPWWFAWHDDGRLAAHRRGGATHTPQARYDASGLPVMLGSKALFYGPGRRLEGVGRVGSPGAGTAAVAEYRHNAFGHRIMKQAGSELVQFLYLHDRLVAESRIQEGNAPPAVTRRYLHVGLTPVGMIEYPATSAAQLYAIHADLSGAPRLITDDRQAIRWMATYSPLGRAQRMGGDLPFALRLPGQYEDAETGWHDNLLRAYAPNAGHYLEPDPLGPMPGGDTYGYAAQQPWRYADPQGLLLFAFDGTRYSEDTQGNVWKLAQAYGGAGAHYHSGPGNSLFLDWDALVAWRAGRILENQWQALLTSLEHQPRGAQMPIDIIGFSRGAALARDFGNRIAAHTRQGLFSVEDPLRGQVTACVDLRFMGLFDTVAQFGIGGSHNHLYDFGIDQLWSWVSHAVALHEHRWAFPLISAQEGGAGNVVEAPFIGAHADIGGGLAVYAPEPSPASGTTPGTAADAAPHRQEGMAGAGAEGGVETDLAKVALQWMHWQALAASADFDALNASHTTLGNPLLRDMRAPLLRVIQHGDRSVTDSTGASWLAYQSEHERLGAATRQRVESLIERLPDWRSRSGDIVGQVDMDGYSEWLRDTLGWAPN